MMLWLSKAYPLKIPVDHPLAVDVYQPPSDVSKLGKSSDCQ